MISLKSLQGINLEWFIMLSGYYTKIILGKSTSNNIPHFPSPHHTPYPNPISYPYPFCWPGADGHVVWMMDAKSKGLGFNSSCWQCVELAGKLLILCCLCQDTWWNKKKCNWLVESTASVDLLLYTDYLSSFILNVVQSVKLYTAWKESSLMLFNG